MDTITSIYTLAPPLTHQRTVFAQPITALSFDPVADTLWTGTSTGSVVAYHGAHGLRGVCFPVGGGLAVRKIQAGETYVRALGLAGEGVGQWTKGGANKWFQQYVCTDLLTGDDQLH
jgi:PAB-dependent poly(A)-specific ribonuclease subunit 2